LVQHAWESLKLLSRTLTLNFLRSFYNFLLVQPNYRHEGTSELSVLLSRFNAYLSSGGCHKDETFWNISAVGVSCNGSQKTDNWWSFEWNPP